MKIGDMQKYLVDRAGPVLEEIGNSYIMMVVPDGEDESCSEADCYGVFAAKNIRAIPDSILKTTADILSQELKRRNGAPGQCKKP